MSKEKQSNSDGDYISRNRTCDYIAEFVNHEYATDRDRKLILFIISGIHHLPSIKLKQIAKWQRVLDGAWIYAKCSSCGSLQDVTSNYCPNCGAKMEESDDGKSI